MARSLKHILIFAYSFLSLLCGCAQPTSIERAALETMKTTSRMYLKSEPYESIILEVDAVEGAQPTEDELQGLVQFLEKYTAKPVVLVKPVQVISATETKGLAPGAIATLNMEGPPEDTEQASVAYMYVLLIDELPKWNIGGYAHDLYPHAIISMSFFGDSGRAFLPEVLKHECGHLLGLCSNTSHGDGNHCKEQKCVMQAKLGARLLFGRIRSAIGMDPLTGDSFDLCNDCQQELRETTNSPQQVRARFRGRFFIRNEKDYFVATLPSHLHLGLGAEEIPWKIILDLARKQAKKLAPKIGIFSTTYSFSYPNDEEKQKKLPLAIEAALKDDDPRVVSLAFKLRKELEKQGSNSVPGKLDSNVGK